MNRATQNNLLTLTSPRRIVPLIVLVCATLLSFHPAIAQFSQEGPKLVGTGAVGNAYQGVSVALSADGNTAIIGGYDDNGFAGAAWVWTRSGGVWTQQGSKLVGTGATGNARHGFSVALSADGNTAIVGARDDNGQAGAAWIWTRSGSNWTQQGTKLVGSDTVGLASQGRSVSLSADGNTAIVGGSSDNGSTGAVWVWTRSGGVWSQQGTKLVGSGALGTAAQGESVSLSGDGNTAIVGGIYDNYNPNARGAAWVWTRSGGVWTQQGTKLVGLGAVGPDNIYQGYSVSLSADGNTAIVGGFGDSTNAGAAWVWTRNGGVWTQQGTKLVGSGAIGHACQGYSVSLSADGNTALVGGLNDNYSQNISTPTGAVWVWRRSGEVWTQQGTKLIGSGANGNNTYQGFSVSLSANGTTAIIGGPGDHGQAGAAWVFTAPLQAGLNILANGNFDLGNVGFTTSYIYSPGNLQGEGTYDVAANPHNVHPTTLGNFPDHTSGQGLMLLVNGQQIVSESLVWKEVVNIVTNTTYVFSGWATSWTPGDLVPPQFYVSINGSQAGQTIHLSSGAPDWKHFSTSWNSGSNTSAAVEIRLLRTAGNDDLTLDDLSMRAVLAPTTPQPALPTAFSTTNLPPTNMVARPRVPSGTQFLVYTSGAFASGVPLDANKMTIVLTHGWLSSSDDWPKHMANVLTSQGFGATANIVAWDWRVNANLSAGLSISASRTASEGEALGGELLYLLGANYNKPIHFMGHSLGTMVNCRAADFIHGDAKNSPGKIPGSTLKLNPQNTHMTMFDEAGAVGVANALSLVTYLFLPTSGDTGDLINNFWTKVIPDHSAWIDNYISEVGRLHREAVNVLLWRKFSGLAGIHGYSYEWYSNTVAAPLISAMGHRFSFERNTLSPLPPSGTYFLQSADLIDSEFVVTPLDAITANRLSSSRELVYPTLQTYKLLNVTGNAIITGLNSAGSAYLDGIQYAGDFIYNVAESILSPTDGQPVYVGTAGSTPAYIIPAGSTPLQSFWDVPFTLQKTVISPITPLGAKAPIPQGAETGSDITNNISVYVWLPVIVPSNTVGMSFEFQIAGAGTNEYMTMGVSNENYFTMESKFMDDSVWTPSGVIEISKCAGKQTQLFFSMNGDGGLPDGRLSVRGIQFFTVAPPTLNISVNDNQAVLSWPVITSGWQLEQTTTLSSPNQWTDVTNPSGVLGYENKVTNALSGDARFYRLKK